MLSRTARFCLVVANTGTAVARDIDLIVRVRAPEGTRVIEASDLKEQKPKEPQPPREHPADRWEHLVPFIEPRFGGIGTVEDDVSLNVEEGAEGPEIHAHIRRLKHTKRETLGPFALIFARAAAIDSVQLVWTVNTEDLAENVEGTLHLVLALGEE
jgi:hypothetical protein